jgi:hypothetical protein
MRTKSIATKAGLVLLGVFLVAGFLEVLEKRFAEGGIYPHYASVRSDPLGTSVLYETLDRIESLEVSRNVTDLNTIRGLDGESAILLLGYPRDGFDDIRAPDSSPVMKAVEEGARLVLTINPGLVPEVYRPGLSELEEDWIERRRRIREERARREAGEKSKGDPSPEPEANGGKESRDPAVKPTPAEETPPGNDPDKPRTETAEESKSENREETKDVTKEETKDEKEERRIEEEMNAVLGPRLIEKLGFEVGNPVAYTRPEEGWETGPGETASGAPVPAELPLWRSQYRFEPEDASWKAVLTVEGKPVLIERSYGKGSVVLATDSYFTSNESLHLGGEPDLILWLLGGKRKIVFDETIHGTVETGGAMKLVRRYRAHGFFLGLVGFLILWAWRSASPLVPGNDALDRGIVGTGGAVMGEATGSGLVRLLRRSIPATGLISRCVDLWSHSTTADAPEKVRAAIAAIVERHQSDPRRFGAAEAYRAIAELLRKR